MSIFSSVVRGGFHCPDFCPVPGSCWIDSPVVLLLFVLSFLLFFLGMALLFRVLMSLAQSPQYKTVLPHSGHLPSCILDVPAIISINTSTKIDNTPVPFPFHD